MNPSKILKGKNLKEAGTDPGSFWSKEIKSGGPIGQFITDNTQMPQQQAQQQARVERPWLETLSKKYSK